MSKLITLKLDEPMLKQMSERVHTGLYSSRTEYIRELVRHDIRRAKLEEAWQQVKAQKNAFAGQFKEFTKKEKDNLIEEFARAHGFRL